MRRQSPAVLSAVVVISLAEITRVGAAGSPVTYMELAVTESTAKKSHQQTLPGTNRGHGFIPLPVYGITPRHSSILFIGGPSIRVKALSSRWPPRWGGCVKQKLCSRKSGRVMAVGELESGAQCGSAVKAVYFMERSCPMSSMAPVLAVTKMVAASS